MTILVWRIRSREKCRARGPQLSRLILLMGCIYCISGRSVREGFSYKSGEVLTQPSCVKNHNHLCGQSPLSTRHAADVDAGAGDRSLAAGESFVFHPLKEGSVRLLYQGGCVFFPRIKGDPAQRRSMTVTHPPPSAVFTPLKQEDRQRRLIRTYSSFTS